MLEQAILTCLVLAPAARVQPADDLDARSILERAIAAQGAGRIAGDVVDFVARATLTNRDPEKGRITFDVECRFKDPDKVWTDVSEAALSGKRFQEGYDGRVAWYRDDRGVRLYEGPDYRTDRDKMRQTARTMRNLLRFFFVQNLAQNLQDLERLGDDSVTGRDGVTTHAYRIQGVGKRPDADAGQTRVTLWIEKQTSALLGVRLTPEGGDGEEITFCFWHHRKNPQGVLVPGSVKIYHGDEEHPSQVLAFRVVDGRNDIRFNAGLEDSLFSPPGE